MSMEDASLITVWCLLAAPGKFESKRGCSNTRVFVEFHDLQYCFHNFRSSLYKEAPMRTLTLHFSDTALPTLETVLKETKEVRVFRRAQAVRDVVKGQRLQHVSDALQFTYSALRNGCIACQSGGPRLVIARAPVDPRKSRAHLKSISTASSIKTPRARLPLFPMSCRELATVFAQHTGVHLGRESVRCV